VFVEMAIPQWPSGVRIERLRRRPERLHSAMPRAHLAVLAPTLPLLALSLAAACASSPPAAAPPTSASASTSASPSAAPSSSTSVVAVASASASAGPSAEEKAKADAAMLAKDRAKFEAEQQAELPRWTPQLRAEAKALAGRTFKNGHEAMTAVVASKHRRPASFERDHDRHPIETFDFYGLQPNMTVLEFAPGEAWFTELLAPALAKQGKLYVTSTDPDGPADSRMTFYGQRFKAFLARSPEAYGKVETVIIKPTEAKLPMKGTLDMVVMMRATHGVVNAGTYDAWLKAMYDALKPGGILAIEQHRAKPDAVAAQSAKKGYVPEKWLVEHVEAAGFTLVAKSEINANPKDGTDWPEGVWTLPPTLRLGDVDRAKYLAIGESDRMTLKFVKKK
jgi:predicted methyltransferase